MNQQYGPGSVNHDPYPSIVISPVLISSAGSHDLQVHLMPKQSHVTVVKQVHVMQKQSHVTLVNLVQLYFVLNFLLFIPILHFQSYTCLTMSKLSAQFTAITASLLDQYIAKKRDERAAVITSAVEQNRALGEKDHVHVPASIQKVWSALLHQQLMFISNIAESGKLVSKQPPKDNPEGQTQQG
jgi:hypothetical protein